MTSYFLCSSCPSDQLSKDIQRNYLNPPHPIPAARPHLTLRNSQIKSVETSCILGLWGQTSPSGNLELSEHNLLKIKKYIALYFVKMDHEYSNLIFLEHSNVFNKFKWQIPLLLFIRSVFKVTLNYFNITSTVTQNRS